ncbi:MAG: flagellar motor protein MotB [Desulfovibrio sp.]|nr:flagellar motor protein MotB [Desulfovibrio sp.]
MVRRDRQYGHRPGGPGAVAAGGNFAEWSVPWSDLMMIMFVVFAMLFIYTSTTSTRKDQPAPQQEPKAAATKAPTDPMQAFLGQLNDPIGDPVRGGKSFQDASGPAVRETYYQSDNLGISVVRETDRQVRVFLRGDLFFASGGDGLSRNSAPYLARIAEILRLSSGAVLVVGHAAEGEAGSEAESLGLSARRAASVAEYFIRTAKLDARRFLITGRGSFQPEAPASDQNAASRNRRVEVLVLTDI